MTVILEKFSLQWQVFHKLKYSIAQLLVSSNDPQHYSQNKWTADWSCIRVSPGGRRHCHHQRCGCLPAMWQGCAAPFLQWVTPRDRTPAPWGQDFMPSVSQPAPAILTDPHQVHHHLPPPPTPHCRWPHRSSELLLSAPFLLSLR